MDGRMGRRMSCHPGLRTQRDSPKHICTPIWILEEVWSGNKPRNESQGSVIKESTRGHESAVEVTTDGKTVLAQGNRAENFAGT